MSKLLIALDEAPEFFLPLTNRMDRIEKALSEFQQSREKVYSDTEAARFLNMSKKKLQSLRNTRQIGFIREECGRKISYLHEHLIEYLLKNEIKAKK